jgi:uncharacterized DUF497 family protein
MAKLRYEWDGAKRGENLEKHGIDFMAVAGFDWSLAIVVPDRRYDYGENRLVAYGPLHGRLHALVFTQRTGVRRIISFRKANRREQATYTARMAR